jgi:hypothetical protein
VPVAHAHVLGTLVSQLPHVLRTQRRPPSPSSQHSVRVPAPRMDDTVNVDRNGGVRRALERSNRSTSTPDQKLARLVVVPAVMAAVAPTGRTRIQLPVLRVPWRRRRRI